MKFRGVATSVRDWLKGNIKTGCPTPGLSLKGEDVAAAVREWIKEDIKKGPSTRHELGKFFVGVSTGSLGLFATLLKFAIAKPTLDLLTVACFVALMLSTVVGLLMAIPNVTRIRASMELYTEYNSIVRRILIMIWGWFALWWLGFVFGAVKLFAAVPENCTVG